MRRALFVFLVALTVIIAGTSAAEAHQPVQLTAANPTPDRGPLLVDGTVSFAVYAKVQGTTPAGFGSAYVLASDEMFNCSSPTNHPGTHSQRPPYRRSSLLTPVGRGRFLSRWSVRPFSSHTQGRSTYTSRECRVQVSAGPTKYLSVPDRLSRSRPSWRSATARCPDAFCLNGH